MYCSWEMMGPPSPALGRSWGKVLLCHKGLGGVFCVSGARVCQPKGPVYQLEYLLLAQLAFSVIPGWTPQLYCCAKSLFTPPFLFSLPPLFPSGAPPSLRPVSPPPFTFLHLAPLSPPVSFFVPHTSDSPFPFFPSYPFFRLSS